MAASNVATRDDNDRIPGSADARRRAAPRATTAVAIEISAKLTAVQAITDIHTLSLPFQLLVTLWVACGEPVDDPPPSPYRTTLSPPSPL